MVGFGIFLLLAGAISEFVLDNHLTVGNQSLDMDTIGMITMILGLVSIVIGFAFTKMYTNTSHREEKLVDERVVVDDPPPVVVVKKPRKKKTL